MNSRQERLDKLMAMWMAATIAVVTYQNARTAYEMADVRHMSPFSVEQLRTARDRAEDIANTTTAAFKTAMADLLGWDDLT